MKFYTFIFNTIVKTHEVQNLRPNTANKAYSIYSLDLRPNTAIKIYDIYFLNPSATIL